MKHYKLSIFFSTLVLTLLSLVVPMKGYGQTAKSVVSDHSVLGQKSEYVDFSILELSSTERGFLLSKMTTAQKESIPKAELTNGLAIFNTDTSCIEYYSETIKDWLSACGDLGPAEFVLANNSCSSIQVMGNYAKEAFLDPKTNLMSIEVTVTKAGSYQIRTTAINKGTDGGTGKNNNYTFKAEGTFLQTGTFTVILKATGKPTYAGYKRDTSNNKPVGVGDEITLYFNNVEVKGCTPKVFIDPGAITFKIASHVQNGLLYQGVEPTYKTPHATLDLKLTNIQGAGEVKFYNYEQNGLKFSGTKFLTEEAGSTATVTLTGEGKSVTPQETILKIYNDSYLDMSTGQFLQAYDANVKIKPVDVAVMCTTDPLYPGVGVVVNETWKTSNPIPATYTITVPVKVLAPGRGRITGVIKVGAGVTKKMEFISETTDFKFNGNNDIQEVIIKRTDINPDAVINSTDIKIELKMVSNGVKEYNSSLPAEVITTDICTASITAELGEATFTYQTIAPYLSSKFMYNNTTPYITPKTEMGTSGSSDFKIVVPITVTIPGIVQFSVADFNGVTFKGNATFTAIGNYEVVLPAYGKSDTDRPTISVVIKKELGINTEGNKSINIDYVYRPMTIYSLGYGSQSWHPAGYYASAGWNYNAGPMLVRKTEHFGWKGIVRIAEIKYIDLLDAGASGGGANTYPDFNNTSTFPTKVDKADIVWVGSIAAGDSYAKLDSNLTKLATSLKNNTVVVFAESNKNYMKTFIDAIDGVDDQTTFFVEENGSIGNTARIMTPASGDLGKLIYGNSETYFGQKYGAVMDGKYIGTALGTGILGNINPAKFQSISYLSRSNTAFNKNTANANPNVNVYAFMSKKYPLVAIGSSGFVGGISNGTTTTLGYPIVTDKIGTPLGHPDYYSPIGTSTANKQVTHTSFFLLNLMHWAIDQAQERQPNVVKK